MEILTQKNRELDVLRSYSSDDLTILKYTVASGKSESRNSGISRNSGQNLGN